MARRSIIVLMMLSLLLPLTSTRAIAADPVGDFSDFLIDRANDNFIYLFQVNLKKNPFFVTYFPETLRIAQSSDLRSLMPNRDLWRESIKRDMETALASKLRDRLVPLRKVLCGYIRYSEDGQKFLKLQNVWGYGSSPVAEKWKTAVNDLQYFCGLGNDPDEWIRWVKGLTSSKKTAQGVTIEPNYTAQDLKPALERPNPSYLLGFRSTPDERVQFILASLSNVISTYDTAQTKCVGVGGKGEPRKSYTQCAIALADFVEAGAHAVSDLDGDKCDKDTKYDCGDNSQILRFRRYAVFFAQLGDLKSEGALSGALLKSVTVPPISFGAKREPDIGLWSVTAYFAASAGHTEGVPLPSNNLLNKCCSLFVPLGFEWSWGTRSRASNSLFVSALDFGNPVTQKLNGTYTGAKLTDVTAPGLFYVHGLQDSPIAWGIGAERVATGLSPNTRETRFLLFIGLDLPLLIMP